MKSLYFSHDANAHDDPKCMLLIEELGMAGYGIFWLLCEVLRSEPDLQYPLKLIPILARRFNTDTKTMELVVTKYGLFEIEEDIFYSRSLKERIIGLSEKRRNAINSYWANKQREAFEQQNDNIDIQDEINCNSNDIQMNNNCNSNDIHNKINNNIEKKNKEKNNKETGNNSGDFLDRLLFLFCGEYQNSRNYNFEIINPGKEKNAIGRLLNNYKKTNPNSNSEQTELYFKEFFKTCMAIKNEKYHYDNMSPNHIASQYSSIKSIIERNKNGKSEKSKQQPEPDISWLYRAE